MSLAWFDIGELGWTLAPGYSGRGDWSSYEVGRISRDPRTDRYRAEGRMGRDAACFDTWQEAHDHVQRVCLGAGLPLTL